MSHLLPAGVYRLLRDTGKSNPNPILVGEALSTQTSGQIEAPLLCGDCEQRFNNRGERWVLQNCFREPGVFRIQEALKAATPLHKLDEGAIYAGAQVANIDVDALVYFAASVFWRAAARHWALLDHKGTLELGPYQEQFRLYLLGQQAFPANAALWVTVWLVPVLLSALRFGDARHGYHQHTFSVPGVTFHLFLGQRIPRGIRLACAARSPERMIFLSLEMNASLIRGIGRHVLSTRATGSLGK